MMVILCEPPADSVLVAVRTPHVSPACANSPHSSRVSPLFSVQRLCLFATIGSSSSVLVTQSDGKELHSPPYLRPSLSRNWIHLLWEAGRDSSPCCPSCCGGQKSSFSPLWMKKKRKSARDWMRDLVCVMWGAAIISKQEVYIGGSVGCGTASSCPPLLLPLKQQATFTATATKFAQLTSFVAVQFSHFLLFWFTP